MFIYVRPLQSPWHPFIAGDGLGYYSYLPARFIHGDADYDFKWFNKVYNANYVYSTFENPEDNLLVNYKGKKINKYYPGLSFLWMPFFFAAHTLAKLLHYPADGFSAPYQFAIGFASLFYLFLGFFYLRRLLRDMFGEGWATVVVPVTVFYGTYLFNYAVFANSLSHVYSFSFIVIFIYYVQRYCNHSGNKLHNLLAAILCFIITLSIRPLNAVSLLMIPAFISGFNKSLLPFGEKWDKWKSLILLLILFCLFHHFSVQYKQTGSLFAYTYSNEKFDFTKNRFSEALFSYHIGLFVYVPLFMLSLAGIYFLRGKQKFIFPLYFFLVLFIYSSWWYWPIIKRAMIDHYVVPAILLTSFLHRVNGRFTKPLLWSFTVLLVIYHQFKELQVRRGALNEFSTHKEIFWKNFFRIQKSSMYPVPPSTIVDSEVFTNGFEESSPLPFLSSDKAYSGKYSARLGPTDYIGTLSEFPYPNLFSRPGIRKIRFSFQGYFEEGVNSVHAFIQFFDKQHQSVLDVPFYLSTEDLPPREWEFKEFGHEVLDSLKINAATIDKIGFTIWNVEAKKNIYIDDMKVEFLLSDESYETIK